MYKNSEHFLTAFTRIEKKLRSMIGNEKNVGFTRMVRMLKNNDAIVGRYSDDLIEYAELRNAIIHNKVEMEHAIAEPHDSVVDQILKIETELLEPRLVNPEFIKQVIAFQQNEPLANLLATIHDKKVSKFPIYHKEEFKGLLTQRAIAYWVADSMYNGYTLPTEITIGDVLHYEKNDNYRFISEDTSVLAAEAIFNKHYRRGNRLEALLITKSAKPSDKLLGIVTNLDMIGLE